jgi:hypothetical protein
VQRQVEAVLKEFPADPGDWYAAEKAQRWYQKHKQTLIEALTLHYTLKTVPPPPQTTPEGTPNPVFGYYVEHFFVPLFGGAQPRSSS